MSITKSGSGADADTPNTTTAATATTSTAAANGDHADITIYGQDPPCEETPEFLSLKFAELEAELGKLPSDKTVGWELAKEKCPELVGEDHRLMFLRCEVFRANDAAARIAKYWNKRIEMFGNNLAFKPLTTESNGALSKSHSTDTSLTKSDKTIIESTYLGLSHGFMRPTNTLDSAGRAIILIDPSRLKNYKHNEDERCGIVRSTWYVMHSLLETNESVQKLGMVVIGYPHHMKLSWVDRKLMKMNMESLSGCIPVRLGAFHICHPPWFFGKVAFPIIKMVMSKRMQKRVRVHNKSEEVVLEELNGFGLEKAVLPSEIGGEVVLDG